MNSNTTKISEKADGSTVTALQANVTALTADLSGFKTTVSQTYTSKTEFNNLQIGGRNLLLNTADLTKWHKEASITVTKDSNDYFKISTTNTSSWWSAYWYISSDKSEQTYTLSGYNKKGTKTGHVVVRYYKSGANNILLQKDVSEGYFTIKFTVPSGAETITVYLGLSPTASGDYTYFKLPKLELGDKATDWTPAPEDIDEKFTQYSTITQMNSAITQSANSVLTTVSSNYATKASLELKIDKDKLISEINASADVITLKSNRFVLDSTNAKIAADGTVNFIGGTIGGWNITTHYLKSDKLASDGYLRRVFLQTLQSDDSWIFSVQKGQQIGENPSKFTGLWYVTGNGDMYTQYMTVYRDTYLQGNTYLNGTIQSRINSTEYKGALFTVSNTIGSNFMLQNYENKSLTNCELSLYGTGRVQYNWHVGGTIYGNVASDSDKSIKKDIQALNIEDSAQFIYSLIPSEFRFKNGTSNRLHHGLIAQEVKKSMGDSDWGLFIDKKVDNKNYIETEVNSETGEQTQLLTARYGLRYDELIADLIATVQSLNNRLKAVENN